MKVEEAYNRWAEQYDTHVNKTRDLEALSLRKTLENLPFDRCLEIGCGTGKNTEWLVTKAREVLAVDVSEEMLAIARKKIESDRVRFLKVDVQEAWTFVDRPFDLVSLSLVLEHMETLDGIFEKAFDALKPGGYMYVGELHPFKQYTGSKARFDTEEGQHVVLCFTHSISDFVQSAKRAGFEVADLNEYADEGAELVIPRILTLLFKKRPQ